MSRSSAAFLVIACVLVVALLRSCSVGVRVPQGAAVVVDTADANAWRERAERYEREVSETRSLLGQLKRDLAGMERRTPTRITVYDTIISVERDTVILFASVDSKGVLTIDAGVPDATGHRPVSATGIITSDCDDGWLLRGTTVICNRARMGHLSIIARAGVAADQLAMPPVVVPVAEGGLRWTPSYRSQWAVELVSDVNGRAALRIERGLRLF
jgi:hypothetical protein